MTQAASTWPWAARFEGRVALLTGATGALGAAAARRLYDEGACLVLSDLRAESLAALASTFEDATRVLQQVCDVTDRAQIEALVAAAKARFGRIDVLLTFAGIAQGGLIAEVTRDSWQRQFDINVLGTFETIQAVLPLMRAAGYGRIVTLSSMLGTTAGLRRVAYGTTKGAIQAMTRQMAVELAPKGITVNTLAPGSVKSEIWLEVNGRDPKTETRFCRNIPQARLGRPEEIAAAAAFLGSDDASYMIGQSLIVDGGLCISGVRPEQEDEA